MKLTLILLCIISYLALLYLSYLMGWTKHRNRSELLDEIARAVNKGDIHLWMIISAMRGPDGESWSEHTIALKGATTSVIRYHIGLTDDNNLLVGPDSESKAELRKSVKNGDHFITHAKDAFHSLGLEWDKVNE